MADAACLVVFGATGMTGLCVLRAAVDAGVKVRAFVRDASKIPAGFAEKVEPFVGNVLDKEKVVSALAGQTGVVVALGTRNDLSPTTEMSEGLKNIIDGMRKQNVNKIAVYISAFLFWEPETVPERFRPVTEDHRRMLDVLKNVKDVDWVAVNPPHIADLPPTPDDGYQVEEGKVPTRVVSKYDLGQFLVKAATVANANYVGKIVGIGSCQQ